MYGGLSFCKGEMKKDIPFKICLSLAFVAGWILGEFILKVFQIP